METQKIKRADENIFFKGYRVINFRPLFFISLSFGLGIFLSFACGLAALWYNLLFAAVCIFWIAKKIRHCASFGKLLFAFALFCFFTVGIVSFSMQISSFENSPSVSGMNDCSGIVMDISETDYGKSIVLKDVVFETPSGRLTTNKNLLLYMNGDKDIKIGQELFFSANVTTLDSYAYGKLNTSYILDGMRYRASVSSDALSFSGVGRGGLFYSVREKIRSVLFTNMDQSEAALAYAMLTGNSDFIDVGLLQNFRYGGVAHIFAVSGLHIGLLYGIIHWILKRLRLKKTFEVPVEFAAILFYVGVCGFSPSSVRALAMCSVHMITSAFGVQYDRLNSVSMAAIVVLAINPVYLFSVGFQLSIAAAGGIVVLGNFLTSALRKIPHFPKKIAAAIGISLSAQIFTFPLLLDAFGYVSAIGLVLNFVFIPLISFVYTVLFLCTMVAAILPIAEFSLFLPSILLKIAVLPIIAFDYKSLLISGFSFGACAALWYCLFFFLSDKINLKRVPKLCGAGILSIALVLSMFSRNFFFGDTLRMSVFSYYDSNFLLFQQDAQTYMIAIGCPRKSHLERIFLEENITTVAGLFVLADAATVNSALPIVLEYAQVNEMYLPKDLDFVNSFQSVNVVFLNGFFERGSFAACYLGENFLFCNIDGAKVLVSGSGGTAEGEFLPKCDLLLSMIYSEEIVQKCEPGFEIYFSKQADKISLYETGDLQILWKDDIISIQEAR